MSRGWMQTYSGRQFWPFLPQTDDICIEDVAHGLAMTCRYGGHTRKFYCPTPDQRVLTADLRWVPAGVLQVGDELLGFDEHVEVPGQSGHKRRRYRHARVLTTQMVKRRVLRLELSDGSTTTASAEHPWLVSTKGPAGNQRWETAAEIREALRAGRSRKMTKYIQPWDSADGRDAGWLAGIYDGEGCFSSGDRQGTQLAVAQNPGLVLDEIRRLHRQFGFDARESRVGDTEKYKVINLQVAGGWREAARLLGSIRPMRLLDKFVTRLRAGEFAKQMQGTESDRLSVVGCWDEGEQWVAGIETSTRTYLCEGYGAHNSVAEHCWHLSQLAGLEALLHDSAEAYLGDVPRPIKYQPQMAEFRAAEAIIESCVRERFHLSADPAVWARVKELDNRILVDEITQLTRRPELYLQPGGDGEDGTLAHLQPLGIKLKCWEPEVAEAMFLLRFSRLIAEHQVE